MKTIVSATLLCLLAGLIALSATAEPCKFGFNEEGEWVSDCYIAEFFGVQFTGRITSPPTVGLPDLIVDDGDYDVNGTIVEVRARSVNQGSANSGDYEIQAAIAVTDHNGYTDYPLLTMRVSGLQAGSRQTTTVGFVSLPDRVSDYDLSVAFLVDSVGWMSGGEIRESDEDNNIFDDGTCRVYGENPDVTVEPCD